MVGQEPVTEEPPFPHEQGEPVGSAGDVLTLLVPIVVGAVLVAWNRRRAQGSAEAWAARRDLDLTSDNRGLVVRYLVRTRTFRTVGGVAGWLLGMVPVTLYNLTAERVWLDASDALGGYGLIFGGYLLGALLAEITLERPRERGRAVVATREVHDYVAPYARTTMRALVAVAVSIATLVPLVGDRSRWSTSLAAAGTAILVVVAVERMQAFMVQRAQPFASSDLVAADAAVRAASVQAATGAGLAIVATLLAGEVAVLGSGFDGALQLTLRWVAAGLGIGAIGAWLGYGTDHVWTPPRRVRDGDGVAV